MDKTFYFFDHSVFYRDIGKGQPVLLLHGFGEDSHIWDHQINALRHHCRLIVPDLPGSGRSPYSAILSASIESMAEVMWALLQSATNEPAIILGHSMGGYVALAMVAHAHEPQRNLVKGLGLIHSTAFADTAEKKEARRKSIEFIHANGSYAFLKTAIPGLFGSSYQDQHPDVITHLTEEGKNFETRALVAYYEAMIARPDRREILTGFLLPVLFVIGDEDKAAPMNDVLQQVYLPQLSDVHILKGIGHMGMLEATDAINAIILSFITLVEYPLIKTLS